MKIKITKIGFYIKTFSTDEVKDTVHVYEFWNFFVFISIGQIHYYFFSAETCVCEISIHSL